ncbi:calcium uptake protein 3, mitochondrial-like isoform X3 [Lineus longissimus]|uniref:calcium uptake protein 3, mitochondrial-like isoform X3 n=1 Tax=Lineus longissimus TaxID=88925 RepID=UPI00315DD278
MAATFVQSLRRSAYRSLLLSRRLFLRQNAKLRPSILSVISAATTGAAGYWLVANIFEKTPLSLAVVEAKDAKDEKPTVTIRESRFLAFASVEAEGNAYMTPQDFLESVTEEMPRARGRRRVLSRYEVEQTLKNTPPLHKGSTKMFRNLNDKGLLSYTEYLFLLCVLTTPGPMGKPRSHSSSAREPKSGFEIAFNMFDADGNQRVDKREFLVLERLVHSRRRGPLQLDHDRYGDGLQRLMNKLLKERAVPAELQYPYLSKPKAVSVLSLSNIFNPATSTENITESSDKKQKSIWDSNDSTEIITAETTLLAHFFGRRGNDVLNYQDFARFMDNLQTEVLEMEFQEFSRGMATISESEFAKILMRYTKISSDDHKEFIDRVGENIKEDSVEFRKPRAPGHGITFKEFKKFFQFLNNLDDFVIAMRMYTFARQPVSQDEFQRAVKVCVGYEFDPHLVETVFQIFDADGDGHLSHEEFVSLMKDRLHRGVRAHLLKDQGRWDMFKGCVKNEMRKP